MGDAGEAAGLRKRLGALVAPEGADDSQVRALESSLKESRRKLRRARRQLRRNQEVLAATKAELADARRQSSHLSLTPLPKRVEETLTRVLADGVSLLPLDSLRELTAVVLATETGELPGVMIEAGTAQGGSAIAIASAKAPNRTLQVYDVFGMIPPPSSEDGEDVHERYEAIASGEAKGPGDTVYYGYREDLYSEVMDSFSRLGYPVDDNQVRLVPGLFEDTLVIDEPVAFAHLDGDWYASTKVCLERIVPHLVSGGRLVLDDYYFWSGCRRAVDEYFADRDGFRFERNSKLHVVRL